MTQKNNNKISVFTQIQSNWKWITILFACGGAGFWMGKYYSAISFNSKISELENQKQLQIIESRERSLELWEKYRTEIMNLENENSILQTKIHAYENGKKR